MAWVAVAVGVGTAVVGAYGASKSAEAVGDASAASNELQMAMYEQTREDQEPWRIAGANALKRVEDTPDFKFTSKDFMEMKDPSYEWRVSEGINAMDRSAASRGRLLSGAQDKAITRYGQEAGAQEYSNAFNKKLTEYNANLAKDQSLAQVGQSATNVVAGVGANTANAMSKATLAAGQAQSEAYGGIATSINQGAENYLTYTMSQN